MRKVRGGMLLRLCPADCQETVPARRGPSRQARLRGRNSKEAAAVISLPLLIRLWPLRSINREDDHYERKVAPTYPPRDENINDRTSRVE